jgi:hypothetical protein
MDESGSRQAPILCVVNYDRRANAKASCYRPIDKFPKLLNEIPVVVFRPSIHNVARAIDERVKHVKINGVLVKPPQPISFDFQELVPAFTARFDTSYTNYLTPWSQDQVIETYKGSKRKAYERAKYNLATRKINAKDGRIKAFGKFEKVVWDTSNKDFDDLVMRLIQPRSVEYCLELGRYIKPLEKIIIARINHVFNPQYKHIHTVMKGLNAVDRAEQIVQKWNMVGNDAVCIMVDAKRFDQHVSLEALEWEHERYYKYFHAGDRDKLENLLDMQLINSGVATAKDGFIKYKSRGCRMSGDMNTSLGNILIMCGLIYEYMHHLNITNFQLINDGDDSGIIVESKHIDTVENNMGPWFKDRGFTMSLDGVAWDVRRIKFCQASPVRNGDGQWIMVRDPRRCMAKDGVCIKDLPNDLEALAWMEAVGVGGSILNKSIPMMQSYYGAYIRNSNQIADPRRQRRLQKYLDTDEHKIAFAKGVEAKTNVITEQSRADFDIAFAFSPREQLLLEQQFDSIVIDISHRVPLDVHVGGIMCSEI